MSQKTYSTGSGSHPKAVAVGYFNNDSFLDIVVANYDTHNVGVFLGYGNGSFVENQIITSVGSGRPFSLAVGDFNNDKKLDIAVVLEGISNVIILLGWNNGSFEIFRMYYMGHDSRPYAIVASDLNSDNRTDLAVVNYGTSELVIFIGNGNGTFTISRYSTGAGSHPISLAVADFDDDKLPDIVVANSGTNDVTFFQSNKNGTVTNMITTFTGYFTQLTSISTIAINEDEYIDIILVDSSQNSVYVFEGTDDGDFEMQVRNSTGINSNPIAIAVGDFDNDDKTELVITNNATNNILVLTLYGRYPQAFPTQYNLTDGTNPINMEITDLNNDDEPDMIVPNFETESIDIFFMKDNTYPKKPLTYSMGKGSYPYAVSAIDLTNDGYKDIIVLLNKAKQVAILINTRKGTFTSGNKYSTGDNLSPYAIVVADLNNDNYPDIVTQTDDYNIGVLFGLDQGLFKNTISIYADYECSPGSIAVNDMNNDRFLDLVVSSTNSEYIWIFLGYGNGSFQEPIRVSIDGDSVETHVLGDLNNDGYLDIVYTNVLYSYVGILLGDRNGKFSRIPGVYVTRGSIPSHMALGYYNDDDILDIAVSCEYDTAIHVFMGTVNTTFPLVDYIDTSADSRPQSIMFVDVGYYNFYYLFVCDSETSTIFQFDVYLTTTFFKRKTYTTGSSSHPYYLTTVDFQNNDNQQTTVVVANSGTNSISLLSNYSDGNFLDISMLSTGIDSHPQSLTIADFNGDKTLDMAVANAWTDEINVFVGFNNGSFDTKLTYSPSSIVSVDINNDSHIDIIVANEGTNNIEIFLSFNYLKFSYNYIYIPGLLPQPYAVIADHFNNDTFVDLAVINHNVKVFLIYLGYGNGSFANPISNLLKKEFSGAIALAAGDFNNDSYTDIVIANDKHSISIFLGLGNGTFRFLDSYAPTTDFNATSVAVADMNHDGYLDIVATDPTGRKVYLFEGNGNGSFTNQILYSISKESYLTCVAIADMDNDSHPDIIFTDSSTNDVSILFGYGNGSFTNVETLFTDDNSEPISIAIDDLDNDHILDIVVANQGSSSISIFYGLGNRKFSSDLFILHGFNFYLNSIYISDINNDTFVDILFTNEDPSDSSVGILYGADNHQFREPILYFTGRKSEPGSLAIGDFNRDGRKDLAVTYYNQDMINIMIQTGFQPFLSDYELKTGIKSAPKAIAVKDLNNDTLVDIVVAYSGTNEIGIFFNSDIGISENQIVYKLNNHSHPVALAIDDFNNDKRWDIAIVNNKTSTIVILFGRSDGKFENQTSYFTGFDTIPISIITSDLNKDNYMDMIVANYESNEILIYYGRFDGSFSTPKSYSVGYSGHPQSIAIGNMDDDDMLDIIVANYGTGLIEVFLQIC